MLYIKISTNYLMSHASSCGRFTASNRAPHSGQVDTHHPAHGHAPRFPRLCAILVTCGVAVALLDAWPAKCLGQQTARVSGRTNTVDPYPFPPDWRGTELGLQTSEEATQKSWG